MLRPYRHISIKITTSLVNWFHYLFVGKIWENHYGLVLSAVVLLALMMCGSAASTPVESSTHGVVDRINYGVIFKREQDLLISREYWLHTFHIELPKRFNLQQVPSCDVQYNCNTSKCDVLYECRMLHSLVTQVHNLHASLFSDYNETMKTIKTLIPQTTHFGKDRNYRSLLPFIGKMYKGLFGLATMDDVNIMASHINAIAKRTNCLAKALEQHSKHLSSFISVTDKRMTNLMHGVKANNELITNVVKVMNGKFQNLELSVLNISSNNNISKARTFCT